MALKIGQRSTLICRTPRGCLDLNDPYAVSPQYFMRARNLYVPKMNAGNGWRARPGWQIRNPGAPLGTFASGRIGQAIAVATIEDGTRVNFCVSGGRLYRIGGGITTYTDVTPAGVTIDPGNRVYMTPFSNRLFIVDDLNTPWVASNLLSTPVTGTLVQYSVPDTPWRTYGPGKVYDDAMVCVVRFQAAESRTARIGWSETDNPLTGWQQTLFDNQWDVIQSATETIYALWGTNQQLMYFRGASIGYASGTIGSDFASTSAKDGIDSTRGTRAPASLVEAGRYLYFADEEGKPHRVLEGGGVEPLWQAMERVVTLAPTAWHDVTARTAISVYIPELDVVLMAIWSPDSTQALVQFPTTIYAFNGATGTYLGEWPVGAAGQAIAIHSMGVLVGIDGEKVIAILGTAGAATTPQVLGAGGYLWTLGALADGLWTDSGNVPDLLATTPPLAYAADVMLNIDEVRTVMAEVQTDVEPALIDLELL